MTSSKLYLLFALSSIGVLLILGIAPSKDYFSEWRGMQHRYNGYLETLPQKRTPVSTGIKQRWNEHLDKVDRCTTCHLGIDDPALGGAPQPFTTHPAIYHDPLDISCTTCHQGQGLATNTQMAHGYGEHWDEPLLPAEYMESSCGKCHEGKNPQEMPVLTEGRELIAELNCTGCHRVGVTNDASFVPSLDGIAAKTHRPWLIRWLTEPNAVRPNTKMPDFKLATSEAELLADFLLAQGQPSEEREFRRIPDALQNKLDDASFISRGKSIFRQARCISCHSIEGRGGTLAPELSRIGSKTDARWLFNFLKNPKKLQPGIPMPAFGFDDTQRAAVTAYMVSEFRDWQWTPETSAVQRDPEFYKKGLKLFQSYNCGGCHTLRGVDGSSETGPDLTGIGGKHLYQLDFGKHETLPRTRKAFIYAKLKAPRSFRDGLRMPEFNLTEHELQAVTTALLAETDERVPTEYQPPSQPDVFPTPEGPFGRILDKYSCLSCHQLEGVGGDMAPDLTRVGSALQPEWTTEYFKVPYSLRPVLTERMPNLFIPEEDIEIITQYFSMVLRDDQMDAVEVDLSDTTLIRSGANLYRKESCSACHKIGRRGGYVGPPLDKTGDRLNAGWVYRWLEHPREFQNQTLEPEHEFTPAQLRALTAYLMSLNGGTQ